VVSRVNFFQLDALYQLAKESAATLRLSRFRPSGRGQERWEALHLSREHNLALYRWLLKHPDVLTADSFFHLSPLGEKLPGLSFCGAGKLTCCITPAGDVYACPFLKAEPFYAGNIRERSLADIWRDSPALQELRREKSGGCQSCPAFDLCHGGCPAAKYFTNLPLDAPDPECVLNGDG
jgi:mycofactocin radical SAM maturase